MNLAEHRTKTAVVAAAVVFYAVVLPSQEKGDSVLNKAGIQVKVITRRDCALYEKPDKECGRVPCPFFRCFYVLPPTTRKLEELASLKRNGFYRVASGDHESELRGWVHEDDVIEWHERGAVRLAPRSGRRPARFYRTEAEAAEAVATGQDGSPIFTEPSLEAGARLLLPVLGRSTATVHGESVEVFRVALMTGTPPPPRVNREECFTRGKAVELATVDVVFVVDTTQGMEGAIVQLRKSIESLLTKLVGTPVLKARLRLGLVAYRDVHPQMEKMEYLTRVFCTLEEGKDHALFLARVASLKAAEVSSSDHAEDLLAGLSEAMDGEKLKWNRFAWKQILVLTDASIKEPGHPRPESRTNQGQRTIEQVMARAQPGTGLEREGLNSNIVISVIHLKDPDFPQDHPIAADQFNKLISGREYSGGVFTVRGGRDTEDFGGALADDIVKKVNTLWHLVVMPPDPGKPIAPPPATATAADFTTPVADILRALSPKEPLAGFPSGFGTEFDAEGNRVFVRGVFVRKGALHTLEAFLHVLKNSLEDSGPVGARVVEVIVDVMDVVSTAILEEPPKITADFRPSEIIETLTGVGVKSPALRKSIGEIAAMSQADYDEWAKDLKVCDQMLQSLLENPQIWFKLHADAKERQEHAFIPLSDLP